MKKLAGWVILLTAACFSVALADSPIHVRLTTGDGSDTLRVGQAGRLVLRIDSCQGLSMTRIVTPLSFAFSNTRIMGPLGDWVQLSYSDQAVDVFDWITWKTGYHAIPGGADTTRIVFQNPRDSLGWDTCGALWWMSLVPVDTGTIRIDTIVGSADSRLLLESDGERLPLHWENSVIIVVPACGVESAGDLNLDGLATPADVLCLIQYVFTDTTCMVSCPAAADANCDVQITTADILHLVRHQLGTGPPPCDVCRLVNQGKWACP